MLHDLFPLKQSQEYLPFLFTRMLFDSIHSLIYKNFFGLICDLNFANVSKKATTKKEGKTWNMCMKFQANKRVKSFFEELKSKRCKIKQKILICDLNCANFNKNVNKHIKRTNLNILYQYILMPNNSIKFRAIKSYQNNCYIQLCKGFRDRGSSGTA